jgi:hypothetical protein
MSKNYLGQDTRRESISVRFISYCRVHSAAEPGAAREAAMRHHPKARSQRGKLSPFGTILIKLMLKIHTLTDN